MAREGLLTSAPEQHKWLVTLLAERAISIEIEEKLITSSIMIHAGASPDEGLVKLHRDLVKLYDPGIKADSDVERMQKMLEQTPDIISVRAAGKAIQGEFHINT